MDQKKLLAEIPEALLLHLPPELQTFQTMLLGRRLLKVYYGDPAFHFEVWFHEGKGLVEVACHGEGPAPANHLLLERLEAKLIDIKEALGPTVELEPWVRSWIYLYRMIPVGKGSDQRLLKTLVGALAEMIRVVQPQIADVTPAVPPRRMAGV